MWKKDEHGECLTVCVPGAVHRDKLQPRKSWVISACGAVRAVFVTALYHWLKGKQNLAHLAWWLCFQEAVTFLFVVPL